LDDGAINPRSGSVGPPVDLNLTTRVVEFNDLRAVEQALSYGDVACVLTEPALTNAGMVLPDPGFHEGLREITRRHGVLLIIDEPHPRSSGFGGYTRAFAHGPVMAVLGAPPGGRSPPAGLRCTEESAHR